MLKCLYQISIIFIINVNCGLIKRELFPNNNQTTKTNLDLINLIKNVTIPNTTTQRSSVTTEITTNLDINLTTTTPTTITTDDSSIIIVNHENNTLLPQNVNSTKEEQTEKNSNNENYIRTTTNLNNLNNELSTTTDQSQLDELSTILNDVEVTTKNNEQGNILMKSDYTTELIDENLFSTTDNIVDDTTTTTTTTDKPIIILNKNDNFKNLTINNNNNLNSTLNQFKLNNLNKLENFSTISTTELLNNNLSTTTLKSITNHHQLKLNKNYDIVTNEIGNLTIPNSTSNNIKFAKYFKENSTNTKNLTFIDNSDGTKNNVKDSKEKLRESDNNNVNISEITEITENIHNINLNKVLNNSALVLPKSSTSNPITTLSTDSSVTLIKNKENYLPLQNNLSSISYHEDVNSVEQNNLMKIEEKKILNSSSSTSTVNNHNNYQDSINNNNMNDIKNSLNDIKTVHFSSIETIIKDIPTISTTLTTETIKIFNSTPTSITNENLLNIQNSTTENYQNLNIYFNKNRSTTTRQPNFTKNYLNNVSMLTTTEINDTTTSTVENNVSDLFATSTEVDFLLTTELNKNDNNNSVDMLENFNSTSSFPTTETLTTSTLNQLITDNNNFTTDTTNNKQFSLTTPINEELFSSTVPESSIETNFIEKTDKSIITSNTTPYLKNNLSITTVTPSEMDNMKQHEDNINNNDTIINFLTTTNEPTSEESTSMNNIVKLINDTTSNIMTPVINENFNKNQSLEYDGMERSSNDPDYNVIIAISVSVIGIVALILLVGFLYVMRKRQKQLTYGQRCRPVSLDAYSLDNVSIYNSVRRKAALRASKRSYGNAAFDDPALVHNNMPIIDLAKFVERKSAINEEFKNIPQIIARMDEVPQGCEEKNRYANVIPLPETRVILQQIDNDEKTEYINANFVRGPKDSPNYYIACQAPLESTVVDFWRMIWEQNSRVIIMATDLIENGIEKCADYLPASITLDNHVIFGDFQITLKNREVKEKYAVSILYLKNMETNLSREITHFWYQWPETGVPSDYAGVIAMLLETRSALKTSNINDQIDKETKTENDGKIINAESNGNIENNNKGLVKTQGPLVIHCSPGTGRTGTITSIDIALRSLETTKHVDIPQIVYYVRRGRASSVQTTEQYEFIYRVVNVYATKITGSTNDN